jgi:hypothetical protein
MRRAAALVLPVALAACDARQIQTVSGGAYRSGQGCNLAELEAAGPPRCPSSAQLDFDQLGSDAAITVAAGNLSDKQISCRHALCGTGALSLHASYSWRAGAEPPSAQKLGEIHYRLPLRTELFGHKLGYALYVDGPTTPVNAYIAVTDDSGRFRMISDLPVYDFRQWTARGGTVTFDNDRLRLEPGTTSLVAEEIIIAVYLATEVRSGDGEHWTADLYVDEISW